MCGLYKLALFKNNVQYHFLRLNMGMNTHSSTLEQVTTIAQTGLYTIRFYHQFLPQTEEKVKHQQGDSGLARYEPKVQSGQTKIT